MYTETAPETEKPIKEKLIESVDHAKETASSCCRSVRDSSCQLRDATADTISRSPFTFVALAAFTGAAVCYAILESRTQPSLADRLTGPFSNSLKFW